MRLTLLLCHAALAVSTLSGSQILTFDCPRMDPTYGETTWLIGGLPVSDGSVPLCGRNVRIVAIEGLATLTASARPEEGKESAAPEALSVAGADNVVNQPEVMAGK
jgi:hypothetical protein